MAVNLPKDDGGEPIQIPQGSTNRTNLTAASTTSNAALPTGTSRFVIVRATDSVWLNFGSDSVTATAAASSILCLGGESIQPVPSTATHAAVLRVGSADVAVQLESLK